MRQKSTEGPPTTFDCLVEAFQVPEVASFLSFSSPLNYSASLPSIIVRLHTPATAVWSTRRLTRHVVDRVGARTFTGRPHRNPSCRYTAACNPPHLLFQSRHRQRILLADILDGDEMQQSGLVSSIVRRPCSWDPALQRRAACAQHPCSPNATSAADIPPRKLEMLFLASLGPLLAQLDTKGWPSFSCSFRV